MARSVIGALRVTLGLDSAQFETGIKRASKSTQQFSRSANDVSKAANLISTSLRGIGAAIGITSITAAGTAYLKLADQSKQLAAQLKLATAQFGSFGQAQQDVNRIAAETRNGLSETGTLYANFMRATKELGGQQWEAARATETFSKTLKISGASQAEAASATLQFGQALASGVLRGDEFNSIMESSPRLARLLADSLNVPIGSLRKMAEDGELTADRLFRALTDKKFTESIDAEFRQVPVTFDEAMQQITNSAVVAFGAFDRGGQFSTALANFATDGAGNFQSLEGAAERFGITAREQINAVSESVKPLIGLLGEVRSLLAGIENSVPKSAKISPEGAASGLDFVTGLWRRPQAFALGIHSAATGGTFRQGFDDFMNSSSAAALVRQTQSNIQKANVKAAQGRIDQGNPLKDAPQAPSVLKSSPAAAPKKEKGDRSGPSEDTLRRRAQREAERAADALRRFTDDLARESADLLSTTADLTGTVEARRDADLNQIETDRQIRERAIQADDQIDAAKKQQLIDLNNQNAQARKALTRQRAQEEIDERNLRIERDRSSLAIELMSLSTDAARTARARRDVELRILDAQFEQERQALLVAAASKDLVEATRARERLAALPALQAGARDQMLRQTQGPLEAYLDRLPRSADDAREALERVQVDGIDGIINGLADAAVGARSLGDVFKQVANQIVADLIRIQLQKAATGILGNLIGGVGSVLGGGIGSVAKTVSKLDIATPNSKVPGFATGGSFKVGGSSSVGDKQLVQIRANRGELIDIRKPGNDNGGSGGGNTYYLSGNLMTPEFWAKIRAGDMRAAGAGSTGAQVAIARQRSRTIP
ncbi:MAG: tape measure protein [Sphingobium sp.]